MRSKVVIQDSPLENSSPHDFLMVLNAKRVFGFSEIDSIGAVF
jgi:hypothetical protein